MNPTPRRRLSASPRAAFVLAVAVVSFVPLRGQAQVGTTSNGTTTTTTQTDLAGILQGLSPFLGGLFPGLDTTGLTGLNGTTGTTTPTTTQPSGGAARQPTIDAETQFTTTTSGALQARRPGLYIQRAMAVQNGDAEFLGDVPPDEPNFFRDTFDQIMDGFFQSISAVLQAINSFLGGIGTGSGSTGGLTPIPNAATTGQGTPTPIQ